MKVDKAVCTTDSFEELQEAAFRYSTVFAALVENKYLSIKKEFNDTENELQLKNRKRSLGCLLFGGKRFFGDKKINDRISSAENGTNKFDVDEKKLGQHNDVASGTTVVNEVAKCDKKKDTIFHYELDKENFHVTINDSVGDNQRKSENLKTAASYKCGPIDDGKLNDDSLSIISESEIRNGTGSISERMKTLSAQTDILTLATISRPDDNSSSNGTHPRPDSLSIDCERNDSQQTIDIPTDDVFSEQESLRLHILDARSISAQCSPRFPRNQLIKQCTDPVVTFKRYPKGRRTSLSAQSDSYPMNATYEVRNKAHFESSPLIQNNEHETKDKEYHLKCDKRGRIHSATINRVTPVVNNDEIKSHSICNIAQNSSELSRSTASSKLVIGSSSIKSLNTVRVSDKCDIRTGIIKHTSLSSSKTSNPVTVINQSTRQPVNDIESIGAPSTMIETHRSCSSTDDLKRTRHLQKRGHRCSDPVIVYPASPQYIMSHIQSDYHHTDELVYHVPQLDINPTHPHKEKHRHHRHHHHRKHHDHQQCKRNRNKRKLLLHDLNTQTVKVIDPDDLPQRARWTIIATACLLLIMCLLLVGVTLRMAPLIDEMVRQEHERMIEMHRGKMPKNFTAPTAATHTPGTNETLQ